jgi:hypothetical protein
MNTSAAIDQLVHLLVRQRNADGFREFIHAITDHLPKAVVHP